MCANKTCLLSLVIRVCNWIGTPKRSCNVFSSSLQRLFRELWFSLSPDYNLHSMMSQGPILRNTSVVKIIRRILGELQSVTSKFKEQQTARTNISCILYVTKNEMVIKEQEVLRTHGFQNMLWKGGSSIYIEN